MTCRLILVVGICLTNAMTAEAQFVHQGNWHHPAAGWWGFNTALGYGAYGYGNFGTTPAESYARGQAELIRAYGMANQANSAAAINYEQARSAYLKNQLQWHQIQLQRQQLGLQQRAQEAAAARASRERRDAMKSVQTASPQLPPYDVNTGTVYWPEVLQSDLFSGGRTKLEDLLKWKVHTGGTTAVNQEILDTAIALRNQLKSEIRNLPPEGYIEARKFLDQLINDVQFSLS